MIGGLLKSTASRLALFAAAGVLVGSLAVPTANAADLGGDCCADLEERVAELEATTARKGNRKMSLTVSGQVNRALMYWNDKSDSGMFGVDNSMSRTGFTFSGNAKVNPRLTVGFEIVIGLSAGARSHHVGQFDDDGFPPAPASVPNGVGGKASDATTGFAGGDSTLGVETLNWYVDDKILGKVTVGRINTATAGTTTVDLGGTGVIANANWGLWNANFAARTPDGTPQVRWNTVYGGSLISINGLSRGDGIRYDTAAIGGFIFSASASEGFPSTTNEGEWDLALRYAGEFSGFRLAAAYGYCKNCGFVQDVNDGGNGAGFVDASIPINEAADVRRSGGSASLLHVASGLFVTGAFGKVEYKGSSAGELVQFGANTGDQRKDTDWLYLQGGIAKNWTGWGTTSLYAEWGRVTDGATGLIVPAGPSTALAVNVNIADTKASWWGIGVVQNIDAVATEFYLGYRRTTGEFEGDVKGVDVSSKFDRLDQVMGGARVKF